MAEKIGRMHADLSANSANFERDMKKARNATQKAASGMKRSMAVAGRAFAKVAKSLISFRSAAVLAAGAVGLGLLVRKAISVADEIAKTADKVGFTTKALQELRFAAGRAGLEVAELDKSLEKFSGAIGEALDRSSQARKTFEGLGLTIEDANGDVKDSLVLFKEFADAILNVGSSAERAIIGRDIFGRSGLKVVNLLFKDGEKGIDDYAAAAARLNIIIGEDLLRKAEKAQDQLDDMKKVFAKTGVVLALDLMPPLQALAKLMTDPEFIEGIKKVSAQFKGLIAVSGTALNFVAKTIDIIISAFNKNEFLKVTDEINKLNKILEILKEKGKLAAEGFRGPFVESLETIKQRVAEVTKELTELRNRRLEILGQLPITTTTETPAGAKPKPTTAKLEARIPVSIAPIFGPIDDAALERIEVDLAKALQKAQGRFKVFGNQTKLAEEKLAAFERAIDSLIAGGALESSPELIEKLRVQIDVLRFSLEKTGDKTEEVLEGMAGEAKILERVFEGVFDSIDKALDSTVEGVLLGTRSMSSAFQDLARNVILSIQKMLIQMAVLDPLRNVFSSFIGGLLAPAVSTVLPIAPPSALGLPGVSVPTLAHGGLITSPTLAMLGEEGPEAVIPLSELRGGSVTGGDGVTIIQKFYLSVGVPEAVRRELMASTPFLKRTAIDAIIEARNRGGGFTKLIGERSKG